MLNNKEGVKKIADLIAYLDDERILGNILAYKNSKFINKKKGSRILKQALLKAMNNNLSLRSKNGFTEEEFYFIEHFLKRFNSFIINKKNVSKNILTNVFNIIYAPRDLTSPRFLHYLNSDQAVLDIHGQPITIAENLIFYPFVF